MRRETDDGVEREMDDGVKREINAVSYTHLTLPTNSLV